MYTTGFEFVEEMLEIAEEHDTHKDDDLVASIDQIKFNGRTIIASDSMPLFPRANVSMRMTNWAERQACERLGFPYGYAVRCPDGLFETNANHWVKELSTDKRRSQWRILGYENGDDYYCRAVLSDEYVPVRSSSILKTVSDYLSQDGTPYKLHYPSITPDELYLRIMFANTNHPITGEPVFGVGVAITNGEIGNRKISVSPFIQRHSCTNSTIFLGYGWSHQHRWASKNWMAGTIVEKIGIAMQAAPMVIEKMVAAEMIELPKMGEIVGKLCKSQGWSNDFVGPILQGTEKQNTLMGLSNGLTWAAHNQTDASLQFDMESLAGALICDPNLWKQRVARVSLNELDEKVGSELEQ